MSTEPSAQTDQPPSAKPSLRIRPARAGDLPALMSLATRLAEFPMPNWRTGGQVIDAERATVARALEAPSPDTPLFVAEDNEGRPVGFALLETHQDYFTGRSHANVRSWSCQAQWKAAVWDGCFSPPPKPGPATGAILS